MERIAYYETKAKKKLETIKDFRIHQGKIEFKSKRYEIF